MKKLIIATAVATFFATGTFASQMECKELVKVKIRKDSLVLVNVLTTQNLRLTCVLTDGITAGIDGPLLCKDITGKIQVKAEIKSPFEGTDAFTVRMVGGTAECSLSDTKIDDGK